jgi:hypothetical protein
VIGPNLERLISGMDCMACGARRPLFNLNTSRLIDYALVYRVCRYCADRLSQASARHTHIPDRLPFFVIDAHGYETSRARRAAVRGLVGEPVTPARAAQGGAEGE